MRGSIRSVVMMVILLATSVMIPPAWCTDVGEPMSPWELRIAGTERGAIYDMAVGELDPDSNGQEIAVLGNNVVTIYKSTSFERETIYVGTHTLQAVAIGDVRTDFPGNEVVVSGMDKQVHVIHREGGLWVSELAYTSTESINGATIGEFDPGHDGKEIACAGDAGPLWILKYQGGEWNNEEIIIEEQQNTKMLVSTADILPEEGDEILVGSFSGGAFVVKRLAGGEWNVTEAYKDPIFAIVGFGFGDMYPGHEGKDLFITTFNGRVLMATWNGTGWNTEVVFQRPDANSIYAFAIGDFDPRHAGEEGITLGTAKGIDIVWHEDGFWNNEKLTHARFSQLFDAEVADVDAGHPGKEVIIGGMFQDVLMLSYTEPDFDVVALRSQIKVVKGHPGLFPIKTFAVGNFAGYITFSANTTSFNGIRFTPTFAQAGETTIMEVPTHDVAPGYYPIEVIATSPETGLTRSTTVVLDLMFKDVPAFKIQAYPRNATVQTGFAANFLLDVEAIGNFTETVSLSVSGLGDRSAVIDPPTLVPDGTSVLTISTTPFDPGGNLDVVIDGTSQSWSAITYISLEIDSGNSTDFLFMASPMAAEAIPGSSISLTLSLQSINDFSDDVILNLKGQEPPGIDVGLETMVVEPPARITVPLEVSPGASVGRYILQFVASSGQIVHRTAVMLVVDHFIEKSFYIFVDPSSQVALQGQECTFMVAVMGNGFESAELTAVVDKPELTPLFEETIPYPGDPGLYPGKIVFLNVTVQNNAIPGEYEIFIKATNGWTVSEVATITVDPDKAFHLVLTPKDQVGSPGQEVVYGIWHSLDNTTPIQVSNFVIGLPGESYWVEDFGSNGDGWEIDTLLWYSKEYGTLVRAANLSIYPEYLEPGTYPFIVEADRDLIFRTAKGTVNITGPVPLLNVTNLSLESTGYAGEELEVSAIVVNSGKVDAHSVTAELIVDGILVDSVEIDTLEANSSMEVIFEWTDDKGEHTLKATATATGARTLEPEKSLRVELYERSWTGPLIGVVLIIIMALLIAAFSRRTREEEEEGEEIPEEE